VQVSGIIMPDRHPGRVGGLTVGWCARKLVPEGSR
jgi:hypothetical protein